MSAQDALDSWKKLARFVESLGELKPWLEEVSSLDRETMEAKSRLEGVKAEAKAAGEQLAAMKAAFTDETALLVAFKKKGLAEADAVLAQARVEVERVRVQGKERAAEIDARAAVMLSDAKGREAAAIEASRLQLAQLRSEIAQATKAAAAAREAASVAVNERDAVLREVEVLKSKFKMIA